MEKIQLLPPPQAASAPESPPLDELLPTCDDEAIARSLDDDMMEVALQKIPTHLESESSVIESSVASSQLDPNFQTERLDSQATQPIIVNRPPRAYVVIGDVATRFNTIHLMFDRILKLKESISDLPRVLRSDKKTSSLTSW